MQALYNHLCEATLKAHERRALCRVSAAFHAALLCEVLQASRPPSDALLRATIPHLLPGLTPSAAPHLRSATLAAAACMLACTELSGTVVAALLTDACSHVHAGNARQTLLFVAHALASQRALRAPPLPAAAALLCMPGVASEVSAARSAGLRVDAAAAALVSLAPLFLEAPSDAHEPPFVAEEDQESLHDAAVQLARELRLDGGSLDACASLAAAIVQELRDAPECAAMLEEAAQKAVEGAADAGVSRVHAAMAGQDTPGPKELPIGRELTAALRSAPGEPEFDNAIACLEGMKATGALDARMHARVADVALGALRAPGAADAAAAAASPLLALLPAEEAVPGLLSCLQAAMRRVVKGLGSDAVSDVAGAVAIGGSDGGGMLWKMNGAVGVAVACLKTLCASVRGRREWEKAVVALVLPGFLAAQQWPAGTLAAAVELLEGLQLWSSVFGGGTAAALRMPAVPTDDTEEGAGTKTKKKRSSKGASDDGDVADGADAAGPTKKGGKKGGMERGAALHALQAAFAAAVAEKPADEGARAWQLLVEVAEASGLPGRHVAAVVAAPRACTGDVEESAVTRACLAWTVQQLLQEGGRSVPEAELHALQKGYEVADAAGALTVRLRIRDTRPL